MFRWGRAKRESVSGLLGEFAAVSPLPADCVLAFSFFFPDLLLGASTVGWIVLDSCTSHPRGVVMVIMACWLRVPRREGVRMRWPNAIIVHCRNAE